MRGRDKEKLIRGKVRGGLEKVVMGGSSDGWGEGHPEVWKIIEGKEFREERID